MRQRVLILLGVLLIVLAKESQAAACFCVAPPVVKSFETSATIFLGEVVQISGPRDVKIESNVEQLYLVKFFVWERWKGTKAFEVEVLSPQKQRSCFDSPPMQIGETYVVFADPVSVGDLSSTIHGIVKPCTLTSRLIGPSPQHEVRLGALATIFELDKLTRPAPAERTPAFGRKPIGKDLCLFC